MRHGGGIEGRREGTREGYLLEHFLHLAFHAHLLLLLPFDALLHRLQLALQMAVIGLGEGGRERGKGGSLGGKEELEPRVEDRP